MKVQTVFYALNRYNHTACLLLGFSCWEHVQSCFAVGLQMPDGHNATGIGRCYTIKEFRNRADFGDWSIVQDIDRGAVNAVTNLAMPVNAAWE